MNHSWLLSVPLLLVTGSRAADNDTPLDPGEGPVRELLQGYERNECAECHTEIASEWAETYHARAWVHERYKEEVKTKRRPESCYGCHIPEPLHLQGFERKPRPRKEEVEPLHFGVSCKSCHLGANGEILGPYGAPTEAHVSVASRFFRDTSEGAPTPFAGSNELCASCHRTTIGPVIGVAKDFELSDQVARGRSCVGCHMEPVYRSMGTYEGVPSEERVGRSHRMNSPRDPEFLASAFAVSVRVDSGQSIVAFENRAGHRVPGLVDRVLTFSAVVSDAAGAVVAEEQLALSTRTFLPADATRELAIEAVGASVRVVGTHEAQGLPAPVRFFEATFPTQ